MSRKGAGLSLPRAKPVPTYGRGRCCAMCGAQIDPIDWCGDCKSLQAPCATEGGPHRRLRKRADAAFCDKDCKARHRWTFIRDCL